MTSAAAELPPPRPRGRRALELAALGVAAIPGIEPVSVVGTRPTRAGIDTAVLRDASSRDWVVAAPRVAAAGAELEAEIAVLRMLVGRMPFATPHPQGLAAIRGGGRALVYPALQGNPVSLPELSAQPAVAASVGRAIAAVHALEPEEFAAVGVPSYDGEALRQRCLGALDRGAEPGIVPPGLLARWEAMIENVSMWRFRPCPVHGELVSDRVLIHDGSVSGIIDWSGARVSDPAEDLAWIAVGADPQGLDHVITAYRMGDPGTDAHLVERAALHGEMALMSWLLHGLRTEDDRIVADATAMLDELAAWHQLHEPAADAQSVSRAAEADTDEAVGDEGDPDEAVGDEPAGDAVQRRLDAFDALRTVADPADIARPATAATSSGNARPGGHPSNNAPPPDSTAVSIADSTTHPIPRRTVMGVTSVPRFSAARYAPENSDDTEVIDLTALRAHLSAGTTDSPAGAPRAPFSMAPVASTMGGTAASAPGAPASLTP